MRGGLPARQRSRIYIALQNAVHAHQLLGQFGVERSGGTEFYHLTTITSGRNLCGLQCGIDFAVLAEMQPLPADWPQFSVMPQSWMGVFMLWMLISLIGSTICMMVRRRASRRRSRRRRLTRAGFRT